VSITPEEAEQRIRSTKRTVYVRKSGNRIRVEVDGEHYYLPYDEETLNRLQALAAEVRERIRSGERTEVRGVSDIALFATTVRGRKPIVENLMEKLSWLQNVIQDIGTEAMIAVLMASGEDPERIQSVIEGARDVERFKTYVIEKFYNLLVAGKDSTKLVSQLEQLKEELSMRDIKIAVLEQKLDELGSKVWYLMDVAGRYRKMLEMAVTLMNDEQLTKFTKMLKVFGLVGESREESPEGGEAA
jgi:hypothetical protein